MSVGRHTRYPIVIVMALALAQGAAAELDRTDISPPGASASAPRIASDGRGNVVAVWRELDGDRSAIRTASRSAGGGWDAGRRISPTAAATEAPQLAVDRAGNAAAIWHRSDGHASVVQAALRASGDSWGPARDLTPPGGRAFNADVAVEAGRLVAVWAEMDEWRSVVRASSRTIAGAWGSAQTISGPLSNAYHRSSRWTTGAGPWPSGNGGTAPT
jgi:hypothetical protein